jgi:hypothetical protein
MRGRAAAPWFRRRIGVAAERSVASLEIEPKRPPISRSRFRPAVGVTLSKRSHATKEAGVGSNPGRFGRPKTQAAIALFQPTDGQWKPRENGASGRIASARGSKASPAETAERKHRFEGHVS